MVCSSSSETPIAITLVIPARNAEKTLKACLESVVPLLGHSGLEAIYVVDDGSIDSTREIIDRYPVQHIPGKGAGAGSARNLGWHLAKTPWIWFVDADCVCEPDALQRLIETLNTAQAPSEVAGVGGSYGNMVPESLLGSLIHEEIVERHLAMLKEVNFLATFNVMYRRSILAEVGGFDERFLKAQDAELAYRIRQAGGRLRFEIRSRVKHFHPTHWLSYLKTQKQQGYWRIWLYRAYPGKMSGDSYSSLTDHLQPPVAALTALCLALSFVPSVVFLATLSAGFLLLLQVPMTARITARLKHPRYLAFLWMGFVRAFARALGLVLGTLNVAWHWRRKRQP